MREFARPDTILILDDLNYRYMPVVVQEFEEAGKIEILHRYSQEDELVADWMISSGVVDTDIEKLRKEYAIGRFKFVNESQEN